VERELGLKRCEVVWFLSTVQLIKKIYKNFSTGGLGITNQWFENYYGMVFKLN
jgi:hypothetical protein